MLYFLYEQNRIIGNGHYMRCKSIHEWIEEKYPLTSTLICEDEFIYNKEEENIYVLDFFDVKKSTALIKNIFPANLVVTLDYFSNQAWPDLNISVFEQFAQKRNYPNHVGLEYSIIRSEFFKQKIITEKQNQIFVYIGGSGYRQIVESIAAKLGTMNHKIKLVRNQNSEPLGSLPSNFEVYYQPPDLLSIMNNSFLAITSPGLTTMELLYLQVPSVLYPLGDMHINFANYFIANNLAVCNYTDFQKIDYNRIEQVKETGAKIIDGNGINRIFMLINLYYEKKMGCSITMWE
jgi:spore coat polysaccharide biosynthesis predicted glycosyltransferase SpsG